MANVEERSFSLAQEQAAFIDAQVSSGAYASGSEVVEAGLRALQERDADADRWLEREVGPAYDAIAADPSRGLSAAEVFDAVRARHATRSRRGPA